MDGGLAANNPTLEVMMEIMKLNLANTVQVSMNTVYTIEDCLYSIAKGSVSQAMQWPEDCEAENAVCEAT